MDFTSLFSKKTKWDWVLMFSYDLYPVYFFETEILNKISILKNITVVVDELNYKRIISDESFAPQFYGVYYNLDRVKVKKGGRFHPKMYLFLSNEECHLHMGSANLTDSGFKNNLEVLISFYFNINKMKDVDIRLLLQIYEFLKRGFTEDNGLVESTSSTLRNTIGEVISSPFFKFVLEQGKIAESPREGGNYYFLHSLDRSLISQIRKILGNEVLETKVLSPYFDSNMEPFEDLKKFCRRAEIYIPRKKSTFPKELFRGAKDLGREISFYSVDKEDRKERFIHAKYYRFIGKEGGWDFITSANFTNSGLLNDEHPRNCEIGVLFQTKREEFLAEANILGRKLDNFDTIVSDSRKRGDIEVDDNLLAIESGLYKEAIIYLEFNPAFWKKNLLDEYRIVLLIDRREEKRYRLGEENGKYFIKLDLEIEGGKLIQVKLVSVDGGYESIPVYVNREKHDPNYLPSLGASAFSECVRIGGISGIEKAIEYARASGRQDWLIYLLSHWNLEKIMRGIEINGHREDDEGDLDELPPLPHNKEGYERKRIRKNLRFILSSLNMYKNLESFLGELEEKTKDRKSIATFYESACFELFFEITRFFSEILEREENKKKERPYIEYPEYTWLYNFNEYYRYMVLIYDSISRLFKSIKGDVRVGNEVRFALLFKTKLWLEMHNGKIMKEFINRVEEMAIFKNMIEKEFKQLALNKDNETAESRVGPS